MLKRESNSKKAKCIHHRLGGLIEYDIQQEFSEIVKHSNDSKDAHMQQLCSKAEQMLQQLAAQVDPAIACSTMLKFFAGKLYIIFLSLGIQFIIIFESIQFATPTLCSPVQSQVFDGKSMRQVELFNGFVRAKNFLPTPS
jgi:hypothetical protein